MPVAQPHILPACRAAALTLLLGAGFAAAAPPRLSDGERAEVAHAVCAGRLAAQIEQAIASGDPVIEPLALRRDWHEALYRSLPSTLRPTDLLNQRMRSRRQFRALLRTTRHKDERRAGMARLTLSQQLDTCHALLTR
ncbi:hypothetical protein GCM10011415_27310 [Salipiger pallidus]|uniref:LTXXQ motif family protein n=1 Tax=Salipiger pallidus TaxID=1775170 RepID=A0A8J3EH92_9RHOB|nr:hypothetical protein [Salipiger pallidus]GGG77003.1 hypothetical protein GCM10011415_27310 [Salipiger pallidus]